MVFSLTSGSAAKTRGLRPIDLRKDLRPIANLIGEAFANELDAGGRASLKEMRTLARLGPLLYLIIPSNGELGGFFRGFVWEEDGEVVGNVTMQRLDGMGHRWMIANVAVHPNFRGRGIARSLMEATLDRIRQAGGQWAMLQVRANNKIARALYEHLGFEEVVTEIRLRCDSPPRLPAPALPSGCSLTPLGDGDWSSANYVLHRAAPELARWWHPTRHRGFRHGSDARLHRLLARLLRIRSKLRLGVYVQSALIGIVDMSFHPGGAHQLDILLLPEVREQWTQPLLHYALRELEAQGRQPIQAILYDYQPVAVETLRNLGFHTEVELVSMRKKIPSRPLRYSSTT